MKELHEVVNQMSRTGNVSDDLKACMVPKRILHSFIMNESLYRHSLNSFFATLKSNNINLHFQLDCFYFCLTGIPKTIYYDLYDLSVNAYLKIFDLIKLQLQSLLDLHHWTGDIFLCWKEDEKQIAIIMSPKENALCTAQIMAEIINSCIENVYRLQIFKGDTRYCNATSLVGPLSGYEAIREGYHSARTLNDLSFLHMDGRIFTEASVRENRCSADYPTILDACFSLRSFIDEGNVKLAEQHLRQLFLCTIQDSNSLALCDDALSFIKSMLHVRCIVYGLQTETPLETLCVREHYHKVEECVEALLPIIRTLCDAVQKQGAYSKPVLSALYYIKMHYAEYLVLTDIARYANINATYLSTRFKEETGVSVRCFITRVRLQAAQQLLLSGHDTVSTVAKAVGFEDVRYFTRVFKQSIHCTPTEYRRQTKSHPVTE